MLSIIGQRSRVKGKMSDVKVHRSKDTVKSKFKGKMRKVESQRF